MTTHCAAPIRLAWSWSQHLGRSQQPADRIGLNLMTAEVNMLTDENKSNDCLTFCQNFALQLPSTQFRGINLRSLGNPKGCQGAVVKTEISKHTAITGISSLSLEIHQNEQHLHLILFLKTLEAHLCSTMFCVEM